MSKRKTRKINDVWVNTSKLVVPTKNSLTSVFFAVFSICSLFSNLSCLVFYALYPSSEYLANKEWMAFNVLSLLAVAVYYLFLSDLVDLEPATNEQLKSIAMMKQSSTMISGFISGYIPDGSVPTNYSHKIIKEMYDAEIYDGERSTNLAVIYSLAKAPFATNTQATPLKSGQSINE